MERVRREMSFHDDHDEFVKSYKAGIKETLS
jgi:hypothetical protein